MDKIQALKDAAEYAHDVMESGYTPDSGCYKKAKEDLRKALEALGCKYLYKKRA